LSRVEEIEADVFLSHAEGAEIFREDVGDVAGIAGLAGMFTQIFLDRMNMMLEMPTDRRDAAPSFRQDHQNVRDDR